MFSSRTTDYGRRRLLNRSFVLEFVGDGRGGLRAAGPLEEVQCEVEPRGDAVGMSPRVIDKPYVTIANWRGGESVGHGDPASDGPQAASRGRSVDIPPPAPRREGTLDFAESVCVAPVERVGRLVLSIDYRRASRRSDSRPGTCVLVWTTSIRERPENSPVG